MSGGTASAAVIAGAFVASLLLVGALRRLALRAGLLDLPNARSSHAAPTPRGGGLAIVIVTLTSVALGHFIGHWPLRAALPWLVGGGLVAAAGFMDDLRGLPAGTRLAVHGLAALVLLAAAGGLPALPWPGGAIDVGSPGWVIGGLAIVWSINLFNFMDGIDGLAAAQALFVVGSAVALQGGSGSWADVLPLLALTGAAAGFLVWNIPPARIFMGDVGSGFIGFAIAAGALMPARQDATTVWTWLVLNGVFVADATVTLAVRLLHGQRILEAHRSHLYQRLSRRWRSHRSATIAGVLINLFWCLPWAAATVRRPSDGVWFAALALAPMMVVAAAGGAGRQDR